MTNGYSNVKNESVNLRLHNEGKTNILNIYENFTETRLYTKFCDSKRLFILTAETKKTMKRRINLIHKRYRKIEILQIQNQRRI